MSKYKFDYSIDTSGTAKISISEAGIIFSKEAIELLNYPQKVNIGIDRTRNILGVREAKDKSDIKAFAFVTNDSKRNWIRIQSKKLTSAIAEIAGIELNSKSTSFSATLDEDDGCKYLIIKLKK